MTGHPPGLSGHVPADLQAQEYLRPKKVDISPGKSGHVRSRIAGEGF